MRLIKRANIHESVQLGIRKSFFHVDVDGLRSLICTHPDDTVTIVDVTGDCKALARYHAKACDVCVGLDADASSRDNGVLVRVSKSRFAYIGAHRYEFETLSGGHLIDFLADGGNNPIAIDQHLNAYALRDKKTFKLMDLNTCERDRFVRVYRRMRFQITRKQLVTGELKGTASRSAYETQCCKKNA
eukprot:jgi/Mesvir1/2641/Mv11251-RA.1